MRHAFFSREIMKRYKKKNCFKLASSLTAKYKKNNFLVTENI
jgi:hypothetical protein